MYCFTYKNKETNKIACFIEAMSPPDLSTTHPNYELVGVIDITIEFETRVAAIKAEQEAQGG